MRADFDDPVLAQIAATVPLPPLDASGDVFHDLVGCLLEQQHPARSTKRTFERLLDRAGLERLTVTEADRFEAEALPHATLSARKREAWAAAVDAFRADAPDWTALPDDDVRDRLGAIHGVGTWTVDMILLFTLGRPDVFPADDYHLKQAMMARYGLEDRGLKRAMRDVAEGWRPHRSLGVRHLLAWKDWPQEALR